MDVVEDEDGIVMCLSEALIEVGQRWLLRMVPIDEGEIQPAQGGEYNLQLILEAPNMWMDVLCPCRSEIFLCDGTNGSASFNGVNLGRCGATGQIERGDAEARAQFKYRVRGEIIHKTRQHFCLPLGFECGARDRGHGSLQATALTRSSAEVGNGDDPAVLQQYRTLRFNVRECMGRCAFTQHVLHQCEHERRMHIMPVAGLAKVP